MTTITKAGFSTGVSPVVSLKDSQPVENPEERENRPEPEAWNLLQNSKSDNLDEVEIIFRRAYHQSERSKGVETGGGRFSIDGQWVYDPTYKGSLAQAEQKQLVVEKVYEDGRGYIVGVLYDRSHTGVRYVHAVQKGSLEERAKLAAFGVSSLTTLQGKVLDAYVKEDKIIGACLSNISRLSENQVERYQCPLGYLPGGPF